MRKKMSLLNLNNCELKNIRGGTDMPAYIKCCCACAYANSGGSSTTDNFSANDAGTLHSPQCHDYFD